MSHFAVAVIHKPEQNIDDLLEPYNEANEVESYIYATKDEMIKEGYEHADHYRYIIKHVDTSEDIINCWGDDFLDAFSDEDMYWATYKYHGLNNNNIDENGNWISTYNPKAKWDWYSIGGRWAGMLNINSEWINEAYDNYEYISDEYISDSAPIKVVDFSPNMDKYNHFKTWGEENVDADDKEWTDFYRKEYYTDYYHDANDYALRNSIFTTFAVVTSDGEWHERGEMGWFGMSSETPEEGEDWDINYYKNFIATADPEDWITIVDCHI